MKEKTFIFYLQSKTGLCYYKDAAGNTQSISIQAAGATVDVSLKNAPMGWIESEIGFIRNVRGYGMNRSFSSTYKLVNDAAAIAEEIFYGGRGFEEQLTLTIFKYNPNPAAGEPTYKLYYKGLLDLPKMKHILGESFAVNLMEGGVPQLIKGYENLLNQIPCDGSIPENIKVNLDGMLLQDTLTYEFVPIRAAFPGVAVVPLVFLDNAGDNIGVIHGDPAYEEPTGGTIVYAQSSANYLFTSLLPIKVRIKGSVILKPDPSLNTSTVFYFSTSKSLPIGVGSVSYTTTIVPVKPTDYPNSNGVPTAAEIVLTQQTVFYFDVTIDLDANEKLFLFFQNENPTYPITIIGGSLDMSFNSQFPATTAWGITWYDAFKLMWKNINKAASVNGQIFDFGADSDLLQEFSNLILVSGDSLRASGDPNYARYFSLVQVNPDAPGPSYSTFGPVLKSTLADCLDSANAVLNAAWGNQRKIDVLTTPFWVQPAPYTIRVISGNRVTLRPFLNEGFLPGMYFKWTPGISSGTVKYKITSVVYNGFFFGFTLTLDGELPPIGTYNGQAFSIETVTGTVQNPETIFLERKSHVFNNREGDSFDLGEVTNFSTEVDLEKLFNLLRIGYQPQTYDQKAGKYEWNTTAEWYAPIKSTSKKLEIISKYRADPYGIERVRSNIESTSTTRNDSDNSVFIINIDFSKFIYDYFEAKFTSSTQDVNNVNNTNIKLLLKKYVQSISEITTHGAYLSASNNPAIFVLNQPGLATSMTLNLAVSGTLVGSPANALLGTPADFVQFDLYINGAIVHTESFTSTSPSVAFTINSNLTRTWNLNDTIYLKVSTSTGATATVTSSTLTLGSPYFSATGINIIIGTGTLNQLVAMPTVTANLDANSNEVVSYGFQYYVFNQIILNSNFNVVFAANGVIQGSGAEQFIANLFFNGVVHDTSAFPGTGAQSPWAVDFSFNQNFALGDILFVSGATTNITTWIQAADLKLTSTQIKAYGLKRKLYDRITGIPNLVASDQPGAPFNIEDLTPKRMLMRWGNYIRSVLFNQIPGTFKFSSLSKNEFLSTVSGSEIITENSDMEISDFADPLMTNIKAAFKTRVPLNFSELQSGAANSEITWTANGKRFYGFPNSMKQKPALNEMQDWEATIC